MYRPLAVQELLCKDKTGGVASANFYPPLIDNPWFTGTWNGPQLERVECLSDPQSVSSPENPAWTSQGMIQEAWDSCKRLESTSEYVPSLQGVELHYRGGQAGRHRCPYYCVFVCECGSDDQPPPSFVGTVTEDPLPEVGTVACNSVL